MNKKKNQWKAWIYLLPALIVLAIFTVWPIINTLRMAFSNGYTYAKELKYGAFSFSFGFENFVSVTSYQGFTTCLGNTLLLTVLTVPISTMLALLVAVALNSIKFVRKTMQTIFFLPYVTNSIAIGMVFMAMFTMIPGVKATDPYRSIGIINSIIEAFGGTRISWVNSDSSKAANLAVLVIYIVWNALPFKILVLLGGLQSVNKQYYEAAKIDGTSRFRTFWRITVPLLSPMIAYVIITGFIGGFKEYSSIVGIFGNENSGDSMGPTGSPERWNTMVGYIYQQITAQHHGDASAAALILFAIIFAVTMVNMYVSKKKVHY
ncbi:MAG: sugar ABC transporter permease [Clostridia bacterium]|nr:sugar ABC transporter permease [Clostridia bacterium]